MLLLREMGNWMKVGLSQARQKSIEPSPLRPHTTMAMEKVKTAARAAHAKVNNMLVLVDTI